MVYSGQRTIATGQWLMMIAGTRNETLLMLNRDLELKGWGKNYSPPLSPFTPDRISRFRWGGKSKKKKSHGRKDAQMDIVCHIMPPHHDAASDTLNSRPTQQSTLLQLLYANQELMTKYFAVQTSFFPTNIAKK
jgi:hypothetical protein